MTASTAAARYPVIAVLATLLALPSAAQPTVSPSTSSALSAAIDALRNDDYGAARSIVTALSRESLSAYERSRAEQVLFNVEFEERNYAAAREHLERAIDAGGLDEREIAQARYQRAQTFMAEELWQDGVATLEAWLATAVQPPASAYYLLAVGYYQSGDFAKALPAVRAAIDRMEQPQESWLTLQVAVHLKQKEYREALPLLNQLIVVAPDKKTYWLQLSSVYGQLDDYANALAIMQLAYDSGRLTESSEIQRLADLLLFNRVPLRAAQLLEDSIAAQRVALDETTYAKLGTAWIEGREFDKAVAPLQNAAALSATGARFVRLGEVHIQLEQWALAEAALNRAIAKGGLPDLGNAQFLMGVTIYEQGRPAEAVAWFDQARTAPSHRDISDRYIGLIAGESKPRSSL